MSSQEEFDTPQDLFDELDREFHFVLDAAASHENAKCAIYFTKEDDALSLPWHPFKRIWCNPPYDTRTRKDLIKWLAHGYNECLKHCLIVWLLPASTDTEWWHRYARLGTHRFIKGRLRFSGAKTNAPFASVIVIFSTWRLLVRHLMDAIGGYGHVQELYKAAKKMARFTSNNHVDAKIRQTLQRYGDFKSTGDGLWKLIPA